jgi:hypothetical protein
MKTFREHYLTETLDDRIAAYNETHPFYGDSRSIPDVQRYILEYGVVDQELKQWAGNSPAKQEARKRWEWLRTKIESLLSPLVTEAKNTIVTRKKSEGPVAFLERCADVAKAINGSVMTEGGPLCPTCAPFGAYEDTRCEILPYRACYNCDYETRLTEAFVSPDSNEPSESGYLYHATNEDGAQDIRDSGYLKVFAPDHGTDQSCWPDGKCEKRAYVSDHANKVWMFAPEEGKSVLLRVKASSGTFRREHTTGDIYTRLPIPAKYFEIHDERGWVPLVDAF